MKLAALGFCLWLTLGGVAAAQDLESIVAIGAKSSSTMEDLAVMLPALAESAPEDEELATRLRQALERFPEDRPLTKARASLVLARGFRIKSSLMFILIPTGRNAYRALVMDGIFDASGSGGAVMSGVELLDFIAVAGQKYGAVP